METILSIIVPTYNHGNYIKECLDSILMQKTKYKYEVLVGEDCSTDSTREKIMEWEKEHPGVFDIQYRDHNMNCEIPNNPTELTLRAKGKYCIVLEGDDYWLDENKIETQIEFLENHSDYIGIAHNCIVVDEKSEKIDENYPECKEEEYSFSHYLSNILPGQTATFMYRNIYKSRLYDSKILERGLNPGDLMKCFVCLCYGKIFCLQKVMSSYRHIKNHGSSFSANNKYEFRKELNWNIELLKFAYESKSRIAIRTARIKYIHCLFAGLKRKDIALNSFVTMYKANIKKIFPFFDFCIYYVNGKLLKKNIWMKID